MGENGKLNEMDLDLRVRDRVLASGVVKPEAIAAYLAALPDVEAKAEVMPIDQPALGATHHGSRLDPSLDDDDDDDDDEGSE